MMEGSSQCFRSHGQQVLVKHGSHYIRVHPCRSTLERTPIMIQYENEGTQETITPLTLTQIHHIKLKMIRTI